MQLWWPPWTSFGPPWTSFGQPWVPCGQKFPVPFFLFPPPGPHRGHFWDSQISLFRQKTRKMEVLKRSQKNTKKVRKRSALDPPKRSYGQRGASKSIKIKVSSIDSVLVQFWLPFWGPKSPLYYLLVCFLFDVFRGLKKTSKGGLSNPGEIRVGGGGSLRNLS